MAVGYLTIFSVASYVLYILMYNAIKLKSYMNLILNVGQVTYQPPRCYGQKDRASASYALGTQGTTEVTLTLV